MKILNESNFIKNQVNLIYTDRGFHILSPSKHFFEIAI